MNIRAMTKDDIAQSSLVHEETFPRQSKSYQWLECSLNSYPRIFCYVATINKQITGYIIWAQKSGFRPEVEATISNLYSADEVVMVARNV